GQGEVARVSSPTCFSCGALLMISATRVAGSAAVLLSKITSRLLSTMQTQISFSDTSNATYCSMVTSPEARGSMAGPILLGPTSGEVLAPITPGGKTCVTRCGRRAAFPSQDGRAAG